MGTVIHLCPVGSMRLDACAACTVYSDVAQCLIHGPEAFKFNMFDMYVNIPADRHFNFVLDVGQIWKFSRYLASMSQFVHFGPDFNQ